MAVEMKWYIFDKDHHPVCWGNEDGDYPACEFDTAEDARTLNCLHNSFFCNECIEQSEQTGNNGCDNAAENKHLVVT